MILTYELTENGYKIFNDGVLWIVQNDFLPHKGNTLQESAENHIKYLLDQEKQQQEQLNKVEQLESEMSALTFELMSKGVI